MDRPSVGVLRLQKDVMFARTSDGVAFSNMAKAFTIKGAGAYDYFVKIHPFLDGSTTVEQLQHALGLQAFERLNAFLAPLKDRGFLRVLPAENSSALGATTQSIYDDQIQFVAHYCDTPLAAFARFRDLSILVVGGGDASVACVDSLNENGASRTILIDQLDAAGLRALTRPDVIITMPTANGIFALQTLLEAHPSGTVVLPMWSHGPRLIVGPAEWSPVANVEATGVTWQCAVAALTGNASLAAASVETLRAWMLGVDPFSRDGAAASMSRLAGTVAAFEVFKAATGILIPQSQGNVIVVDSVRGEVTAHRVSPRGYDESKPRLPLEIELDVVSDDEASSQRATLDDLVPYDRLIDPLFGPIYSFADAELPQLPVKVSKAQLSLDMQSISVRGSDLWNVAGARRAAAQRASILRLEREESPVEWSESQPPWVVYDSQLVEWSGARSPLIKGVVHGTSELVGVPLAAVHSMSSHNRGNAFLPSVLGTGLGRSARDAMSAAIDSAAVLSALNAAIRRAVSVQPLTSIGFESPEWAFHAAESQALDVGIRLSTLGRFHGREVVLGRVCDEDANNCLWFAAAAHGVEGAAVKVMTELQSNVQFGSQDSSIEWSQMMWPALTAQSIVEEPGGGANHESILGRSALITVNVTTRALSSVGLCAIKALPVRLPD